MKSALRLSRNRACPEHSPAVFSATAERRDFFARPSSTPTVAAMPLLFSPMQNEQALPLPPFTSPLREIFPGTLRRLCTCDHTPQDRRPRRSPSRAFGPPRHKTPFDSPFFLPSVSSGKLFALSRYADGLASDPYQIILSVAALQRRSSKLTLFS